MNQIAEKTFDPQGETPARQVRLFRNGANQAVRIPREFELAGTQAMMRKVGNSLVIELLPVEYPRGSPQAFLQALDEIAKLGPCDDEFPDVDAGMLPLDDIVL
ncbi:antitoxin [Polaromonas naphthalenivorans]|uniref:Virulence-associated protein VapB-like protein n=1 Tax=Polaromonas naphthalenivorans (strain CJ2) TaxID=365044 RepID=A1VQC6_POLNA|nr:virulence-associated protein VapB [Polaromonas naphthalenivorans]ABM37854.1 virulence-associated protein VapB-like protein [Polaromonas naphthalenivorans CJ2]